jgi:hypothetical protein
MRPVRRRSGPGGGAISSSLYPLEDQFAAKGTSAPVILDRTDKEVLLAVLGPWIEQVGEERAVALGGLLGLRDALQADLGKPPAD